MPGVGRGVRARPAEQSSAVYERNSRSRYSCSEFPYTIASSLSCTDNAGLLSLAANYESMPIDRHEYRMLIEFKALLR